MRQIMIKTARFSLKLLFTLFAIGVVAACAREQPVLNINNAQFPSSVADKLTLDEVAAAISTAGKGRQDEWIIRRDDNNPNQMVGELFVRQHYAKVTIPFTKQAFSITYADSKILRYDGTVIHRNYNKWVGLLRDDIINAVAKAAAAK